MTTKADQSPMHDPTNTADPVPPGATRQAIDRDTPPEHGGRPNTPGPLDRHAAGEPGGGNSVTGLVGPEGGDKFDHEGEDPMEQAPPYSGPAGGGIAPQGGKHDADTTVGSKPKQSGG